MGSWWVRIGVLVAAAAVVLLAIRMLDTSSPGTPGDPASGAADSGWAPGAEDVREARTGSSGEAPPADAPPLPDSRASAARESAPQASELREEGEDEGAWPGRPVRRSFWQPRSDAGSELRRVEEEIAGRVRSGPSFQPTSVQVQADRAVESLGDLPPDEIARAREDATREALVDAGIGQHLLRKKFGDNPPLGLDLWPALKKSCLSTPGCYERIANEAAADAP